MVLHLTIYTIKTKHSLSSHPLSEEIRRHLEPHRLQKANTHRSLFKLSFLPSFEVQVLCLQTLEFNLFLKCFNLSCLVVIVVLHLKILSWAFFYPETTFSAWKVYSQYKLYQCYIWHV